MAVVWVTGASSGLGRYTAEALLADGWLVVGGARSFQDEEKDGMHRLHLDVSDGGSVRRFADEACARFGAPDALVNAAGVLCIGACEDYSEEELRRVMEINFFGTARMVKAALPLMREKGRGRVVNFSSINGLLAVPFQGAYTASKHAVEGYSEALRMELLPQGVEVMLVEPGDHRGGSRAYRPLSAGCAPCYEESRRRAAARIARDEDGGAYPARLGRRVAAALRQKRLPLRLRVAQLPQHGAVFLHDLLPGGLFTRLVSRYYGVRGPGGAGKRQ